MLNSPFFCSHCGRDLMTEHKFNEVVPCNHCNKHKDDKNKQYKGLLGESTWWQKRK